MSKIPLVLRESLIFMQKSPPIEQMSGERSRAWSITINNPISADEENINEARQKGWKVLGQLEQGANGTKHYQLLVKTPRIRFGGVKKQFPRAHIEVARNVAALEQYVQKDDTRVGELQQQQDQYPSLQKLWTMWNEWITANGDDLASETWSEEKWVEAFDEFINDMIIDGYVVETMAVNPQIRACVKKYARSIIVRARRHIVDGRTDGQEFVYMPEAESLHNTNALRQTNAQEESRCSVQEEGAGTSSHGKTE